MPSRQNSSKERPESKEHRTRQGILSKRPLVQQQPKLPAGTADKEQPSIQTVRKVPFGKGLISTSPSTILTAAIVVPPDNDDREQWDIEDQVSVLASLQLVADRSSVERVLDVSVGGYGVLSGVALGLDASYSKLVRVTNYSINVLVVIHVISKSKSLKKFALTGEAQELLTANPEAFFDAYGDYFCSEKHYGGVFAAVGRYTTNSTVMSEQIKASLDAISIQFGAWADVKSVLTSINSRESFEFNIKTEGVIQELPTSNYLKSPDKFISLCNAWIAKAALNKTVAVRDYFSPYSAVPKIAPKPPVADWGDYLKLLKVRDEAQDLLQTVLDIRANRDAFEKPVDESFLEETRENAADFVELCEERIVEIAKSPLSDVIVPDLKPPDLPAQNPYSKEAIHSHLTRGYYKITVTLESDVAGGTEKSTIQKGKAYEIFIREGNRWFCLPPKLDDPRPKDVTTTPKNPAPGKLWMWGVLFLYDNRGEVVHYISGVKGRIAVLS